MNKKITIFLLICSMFIGSIIGINEVNSVTVSEGTNPGTHVNPTNGCTTNCYNLGTVGIRVSLVNKSGIVVSPKVQEYWFYKRDEEQLYWRNACLSGRTTITCYTNNNLYTDIKENITVTCKQACISQNDVKSINDVMPGILTNMTRYYQNNKYTNADIGLHVRKPNSANTIIERIMANINGTSYGSTVNTNSERYLYINNLLKDLGTNYYLYYDTYSNKTLSNMSGEYFLQFEPLVQYGNYSYETQTTKNFVFMGTIADFKKVWKKLQDNQNLVYIEGFKNQYGVGIYSTSSFPDIYRAGENDYAKVGGSYFEKYYADAISFISLKEYKEDDNCSDLVIKYIEDETLTDANFDEQVFSQDKMNQYSVSAHWLTDYASYGFNVQTLKNYLANSTDKSCPKPACNLVATNLKSKFEDTLSVYTDTIRFLNNKFTDFKEAGSGEIQQAYVYHKYRNNLINVTNYCGVYTCEDLLGSLTNDEKTEENLLKIYNLFKDKGEIQAFLNPETLYMLYAKSDSAADKKEALKKAACNQSIPECSVNSTKASCLKGGSEFNFSDTITNQKTCITSGFAYTHDSSGNEIDTQTSFDYEYGNGDPDDINNPPGACHEQVLFNFPTSATTPINAGSVFRWGIEDLEEADSNLFGTMTVTRLCYLSKEIKNSSSYTITSKWADVKDTVASGKINPLIELTYQEAKTGSTKTYNNEKLKVVLANFEFEDVSGNRINNREMKCGGSTGIACNSLEFIKMTATYNVVYGEQFRWYSDKSDGDKLTKEEDKDINHSNSYVYLGYGLPTSFLSSTLITSAIDPSVVNKCSAYGGPGDNSFGTDTNRGSMYVELSQIGTENRNGGYHFDNYINNNLVTDDDIEDKFDKILYSCTYQIRNPLFDNESGNGDLDNCTNTPPKGLDVVFRTVSLVNDDPTDIDDEIAVAFPGRVGNGRALGSNWEKINAVGTNGKNQILQILSNDVYDQEPLYEIELDVSLIQEIREANRNARDDGKDPYTDMTAVPPLTYYVALDEGYLGYVYTDTGGVYSGFLGHLSRQGELESVCLSGVVTTSHEDNCNQSWWLDTDKHIVTIE